MNIKILLAACLISFTTISTSILDTQPIKFTLMNDNQEVIGIVHEETVHQINPGKEVSRFFLFKDLPVTIAIVFGPQFNKWVGNLTLTHDLQDNRLQHTYSLVIEDGQLTASKID